MLKEMDSVWQTTRKSEEGLILNGRERWERYKPESMTDLGEWQKILGYDVNNLEHMRLTDFITIGLVDLQNQNFPGSFSQEEKNILRKTAMVHDLPEADSGDINYELKTDDDEKRELQLMRKILSQGSFPEVISKDEREQIILILKDKESKLGEAFNIVERIGYFRTGMVAWKKSESHKFNKEETLRHLKWITNNVLMNQIPVLVEKSDKFALVQHALGFYKETITAAFENMPEDVFEMYEIEKREEIKEKFRKSKKIWKDSIITNRKS